MRETKHSPCRRAEWRRSRSRRGFARGALALAQEISQSVCCPFPPRCGIWHSAFWKIFLRSPRCVTLKSARQKESPKKPAWQSARVFDLNERVETPHCRLGDLFSPIGLVAASLDTCMLTIIGAVTRRHGIDLRKTTVKVLKETTSQVAGLNIH